MPKHHNTPGERRPPASARTAPKPSRQSTPPPHQYAVLAILVGFDGAIHCTLNLVDAAAHLILLAGAIKYPSWMEFFADPATWHLNRSARRWYVKPASGVALTALPPLSPVVH